VRIKDLLKGTLSEEELRYVPSSFDIIGSREKAVAIVEVPTELEHRKNEIAKAIMKIHKNVKTVLAKKSARKGPYRIRELELVLGDPNTEVLHKEHGYLLKLDPRKVYFSPREATERQRVAKQVKPGEFIMLMFAGVGPYAFAILKWQPLVEKIVAIEINPYAFYYLLENIKLNKAEDKIVPILGDVRYKAQDFYNICDRVIMPLPKGAYLFLEEAFSCLKPEGGIIHVYHWAPEDDLFSEIEGIILKEAKRLGYRVHLLNRRKVLPYAPRIMKVCVEFKAWKN